MMPEAWESQIGRAKARIIGALRRGQEERAARGRLSRERAKAAYEAVERGQEADRFLSSDFWKKRLEPMLAGKTQVRPWRPGDSLDPREVASQHLYASGRAGLAAEILSELKEWVQAGAAARDLLAADEEEKQRAADNA
jgi:hypothetical protein